MIEAHTPEDPAVQTLNFLTHIVPIACMKN